MRVNRTFLYWGVFLLALGGAVVVVNAIGPDPAVLADVAQAWPLILVAIGIALVLRRTRFNVAGGMLAAAVPGLLLGSALAVGPSIGWDCAPGTGELGPAVTRQGSFDMPASVDVSTGCGRLTITTNDGQTWELEAANSRGESPIVEASPAGLSVSSAREGHWLGAWGRDAWQLTLPRTRIADLDVTVNAGEGEADLAGAEIGSLTLTTNAGKSTVDLSAARVDAITATVNAGKLSFALPGTDDTAATVSINAGSADVCVPDTVGVRVRSSGALSSTDLPGLVQRDGAWESPGYAAATHHADLTVSVNLGSLDLNPAGGCS